MSSTLATGLRIEREALAALELASIARGIVVLDQMAKRAATTVLLSRTLSTGRYLILINSSVAEIEEAVTRGLEIAGEDLVDHVILRDPAPGLVEGLAGRLSPVLGESLGIVETSTVSSALLAVDRTLKELGVRLLELRLGAGLSGKGVFTLTGPLDLIDTTRDVVSGVVAQDRLLRLEVIAQPHPDLPSRLLEAEPAMVRGIG